MAGGRGLNRPMLQRDQNMWLDYRLVATPGATFGGVDLEMLRPLRVSFSEMNSARTLKSPSSCSSGSACTSRDVDMQRQCRESAASRVDARTCC